LILVFATIFSTVSTAFALTLRQIDYTYMQVAEMILKGLVVEQYSSSQAQFVVNYGVDQFFNKAKDLLDTDEYLDLDLSDYPAYLQTKWQAVFGRDYYVSQTSTTTSTTGSYCDIDTYNVNGQVITTRSYTRGVLGGGSCYSSTSGGAFSNATVITLPRFNPNTGAVTVVSDMDSYIASLQVNGTINTYFSETYDVILDTIVFDDVPCTRRRFSPH